MKIGKNNLEKQLIKIRNYWFFGTILTAFGVIISTTLNEQIKPMGIVIIAIGGIFFIISLKKKNEQKN